MADKVIQAGVEYSVGDTLRLEEVPWLGISTGYRVTIAELRDPEETEQFIGADLDGIEDRLWFAPSDIITD